MMRTFFGVVLGLVAGLVVTLAAGCAEAQMPSEPPLVGVRSINAVLDKHPGQDVHMVLVHGIRTDDPNTWDGFRAKICGHLSAAHRCKSGSQPSGPVFERLILQDDWPRGYFLSNPIWKTQEQWRGSQPFIEHYTYDLQDGGHLILDEVNWWPLVLALKCQFIVPNDTDLVGPDADNVTHCQADAATHRFGWLSQEDAQNLLKARPASGGAPKINKAIKTAILDWGISDSVLSLGTMKTLLRDTIRCSFDDIVYPAKRAVGNGSGRAQEYWCDTAGRRSQGLTNQALKEPAAPVSALNVQGDNFVVVSHSLGAFLLLDTFAASAAEASYGNAAGLCPAAPEAAQAAVKTEETQRSANENAPSSQSLCLALRASSNLYFLANQFVLTELGRAQGIEYPTSGAGAPAKPFTDALTLWAQVPAAQPRQILAFSDPGDLLTFKVPSLGSSAKVFNAYPNNKWFHWFGFFEDPVVAHQGYLTNDKVLQVMFGQ